MSIKIVHTADIHIGMKFEKSSFSGEFSKIRLNEIKQTFYNIIEFSNQYQADFLIISGDLFENQFIKRSDLKNISKAFGELEKTKVIIAAGNHDPVINGSYYQTIKFSDNVYIFDTKVEKLFIEELNTCIYGYSWDKQYITDDISTSLYDLDKDKNNILAIHGDVYQKDSSYLPINKDNILNKGFEYIALGHIHKHDFISKNMAYPGSPEPLDFSETDKHGIIYGEISKASVNLKFKPFSKREFIVKNITIDETMAEKDIYDKIISCDIESNRLKNMYRIVLDGIYDSSIELDENNIKDDLKAYFAYIEVKNKARVDYDLALLKKENKDNLIGYFIEHFENLGLEDDINKDALKYGLEELLNNKEGL